MRTRPLLPLTLAALLAATSAHAQLVQSTFAAGDEGWKNVTLPYPSAVPPTVTGTYTPTWDSSSGGSLRLNDPDGSGSSGDCQYWSAPAEYLGNRSLAYGGTLSFDLACAGSGFGAFHQEDILLVSGGLTLVYDLVTVPPAGFAHYSVPLSETGWHKGDLLGPTPTTSEFRGVLATLVKLYIRAEYQLGPDTQYLDNVVISTGTLGVGNAPRALELAPPSPNPSSDRVRLSFTTPRAAEAAVEVFDATGRRLAILARGRFAAGTHALSWDGRDADGGHVPAGLYWARVRVGEESVSRLLARVN